MQARIHFARSVNDKKGFARLCELTVTFMMLSTGSKQQGINLVQLLAAILIIAILTLLITPTLTDLLGQYRLKSATEALYGDLLRARSEAIQRQTLATFVFQTGATWCYGITTASNCDCSTANNCNLGQRDGAEFSSTTLSVNGFPNLNFTFEGTRGVASTTGDFILSDNNGYSITIRVNKIGLPHICSTDVGGYSSSCL